MDSRKIGSLLGGDTQALTVSGAPRIPMKVWLASAYVFLAGVGLMYLIVDADAAGLAFSLVGIVVVMCQIQALRRRLWAAKASMWVNFAGLAAVAVLSLQALGERVREVELVGGHVFGWWALVAVVWLLLQISIGVVMREWALTLTVHKLADG